MKCKLCLEDKPLLKKSHIIPDFMYQGLFDENHKLYKISSEKSWVERPSDGEYESDILCSDCDNVRLGKFETYAASTLYGKNLPAENAPKVRNEINQNNIKSTYCSNIEYKKFKLFLLSILWKASISARPVFEDVNLDKDEEIIRKMLLEENPGEIDEYPCFMVSYLTNKELSHDIIGKPIKVNEGMQHTFLIGGIYYNYYLNKEKLPKYIFEGIIKKSNELRIVHIPDHLANSFLKSYFT